MQSKFLNSLLIIITIISAVSCRKVVDNIDIAKVDDKVILQSYITPQSDSIFVSLSIAEGILDNRKKITLSDLENATVSITSDGITKNLTNISLFVDNNILFAIPQTELPVISGKTYTISVSNGTVFQLSATTTVPDEGFDFSHTASETYTNSWGEMYRKITLNVNDIAGQNNYYRISLYNSLNDKYYSYYFYKEYFSDNDDALSIITEMIDIEEYTYSADSNYLVLANISEDYYKFQTSLEAASNNDGNPFAEPTTIYTNVEGGFGVFASMVLKQKLLK